MCQFQGRIRVDRPACKLLKLACGNLHLDFTALFELFELGFVNADATERHRDRRGNDGQLDLSVDGIQALCGDLGDELGVLGIGSPNTFDRRLDKR